MKNFSSRLEELRKGRTQREFAQLLGVPLTSYTNWVLEVASPKVSVLETLCSKLGVSADYLLGFIEDPKGTAAKEDNIYYAPIGVQCFIWCF